LARHALGRVSAPQWQSVSANVVERATSNQPGSSMNLRTLLLLAIFTFGGAFPGVRGAHAQTVTPPREDQQFWNETQIIKRLDAKHDLIFTGVIRLGRGFRRPVDERAGIGVSFKLKPYLTVTPTYTHVEYQPYAGLFIHEERLILNVTAKASLGKFVFTDRNLLERRVRPSSPDFTVYRNRLQLDHPWRIKNWEFRPFVADEIWYSTQPRSAGRFGWFRNRISAGIIKQFNEKFAGEFFVLKQHDGVFRPGNVIVAGTLFRYTL
jgi:hypothetical protein